MNPMVYLVADSRLGREGQPRDRVDSKIAKTTLRCCLTREKPVVSIVPQSTMGSRLGRITRVLYPDPTPRNVIAGDSSTRSNNSRISTAIDNKNTQDMETVQRLYGTTKITLLIYILLLYPFFYFPFFIIQQIFLTIIKRNFYIFIFLLQQF